MKLVSLSLPINTATGAVESINFALAREGETLQRSLPSDHPNFARAEALVEDFKAGSVGVGDLAEALLALTDLVGAVASKIETVSGILHGRMTIENGKVFVDGDAIDLALENYILRMLQADGTPKDRANWTAFANFVEKLYSNVSPFVREQLFGWFQYENMHNEGFTLTPEGDIIGYKGCQGSLDAAESIRTGTAVVNGVRHSGHIPNPLGAVVEMPRSQVEDDPTVGCAPGLHVGTYAYASSWSRGVLLKVKFSPADVVSVPTECNAQKIRTCRYTVLEVIEGPDNGLIYDARPTYAPEAPVDEAALAVLEDAAVSGKPVTFEYKSYPRSVTVQEVYEANGRTYALVDDNGQTKTFIVNRMSNVAGTDTPTPEGKGTAADLLRVDVLEAAIKAGEAVAFTYKDRDRVVVPLEVGEKNGTYHLLALAGEKHRSFKVRKMDNVRFASHQSLVQDDVPAPEAPAGEAPKAEEPKVEAAPGLDPLIKTGLSWLADTILPLVDDILARAEEDGDEDR